MKKSGVIAILSVAAAALVAANGVVYLSKDRTKPEIHFPTAETTYTEGEKESDLLKGVTAADNKDGDVTSSLRISSIIPNKDNTEVTVEYTAKDSSNNIAKATRIIPYEGSASVSNNSDSGNKTEEEADSTVSSNTQEDGQSEGDQSAGSASQGTASSENTTSTNSDSLTTGSDETEKASSDETAIAALPAGSPQIKLTTHAVSIPVGGTFSYMTYIASMTDDKDNSTTLAGRIELTGDTVDTSKVGTYTVTYVIRDSDGNISNQPSLTVTVQ